MGVREQQTAATREAILDSALGLFLTHGFDATRMEEIAERAGIGTSTLYRYFPTKDQLITEPIALRGQLAGELRERPAGEPLDVALGHALVAFLTTPRTDPERLRQVLAVLADAPGPQARLQEAFTRERQLLEAAIAERLGRPGDDVVCLLTARLVTSLVEIVGVLAPPVLADSHGDDTAAGRAALELVRDLLHRLHAEPPVVPRLEGQP